MTLDHRVPTATKGHFHSILVSNIFSNPLFLLSARCRGKAVYGLWHFNQISDLSFIFHMRSCIHMSRAIRSALPILADLHLLHT